MIAWRSPSEDGRSILRLPTSEVNQNPLWIVLRSVRRIDAPDGAFYKIGISNLTVWERYPYASDQNRITILREWPYELGADAAAHEKEVLRKYEAYRYSGLPVLLGVGVTEIFTCDVLGLDSGDPLDTPQLSLFD